MPSLAGSGRTGGREAHKMKTLMRHGLAVCLALTTMCTSLLLMYGGIGGGGGHPEPPGRRQQVAAVPSRPPGRGQHQPALPVGAGLLEGYISVLEHKPLKMHCKSCALVTSSGHLLGSKQGDRIDETECVIRMNDAPTRGYGKDVGNKTSLRVIAHSSIQRILRNRNELLNMSHGAVFIFWGPSSYMRRDGKGLVYNNLQLMNQILPQLKAYMISRHKMLQFDDLFKRETGKDRKISNTWLSTGWFTMTIALELCDRINVYGMVPPDFCRDPNHLSVPYHYYEPLGPDECTMYISHERGRKGSHHRFITEKRVFENWARTFNIHFFQPDWKPEPLTVNHPEVKPVV
ncbi:alpha-N-acetylgalactosaminide alpha-2,6-sialyltransferase 5 isoform X1 [Falco biarmicus]|uniref:alpha-N-acetylgalactosaminide alpha-2,6-sialyltransferase 5 isoform X1 n=1 Tax=Falco rusticolus TaxID=120794 RepID=UPI0018865F69|nr:alpha-N-acetylgalactosaminide alpha-2,6-sialyltransferase 5 isoform X1 [Falco rusticolus]XP_055580734.1 alpha-N-acetylgalactosaminide alpha-2,6-sialyltransferase 5 isoform X1 [Falco cherrug]XP_055671367.1 alpha-N-acetylgalactosaminide alpha-2,6-sialyltransferase 5 isoform X1 [Falco peregrinus]XP_056211893.1 alpha-N-acetylgalactosaminide alpha-2,6-sialyltransferase 5 isoform X1 [Falco biarmicus]